MKPTYVIILGAILTLMGLILVASNKEDGDINAIGMYVVVFLFPIIIISCLNGLLLSITIMIEKIALKRLISLVPILILLLVIQYKKFEINLIDGDLSFLSKICLFSIGITNIVWNLMISETNKNNK